MTTAPDDTRPSAAVDVNTYCDPEGQLCVDIGLAASFVLPNEVWRNYSPDELIKCVADRLAQEVQAGSVRDDIRQSVQAITAAAT